MTIPPTIAAKIADIRAKLARPCTVFTSGGFRPTHSDSESWIGRVYICRPEETVQPQDTNGKPLYPLAQIYLPSLPYIPAQLRHITWLTLFIGDDIPPLEEEYPHPDWLTAPASLRDDIMWHTSLGRNGNGWLIREYTAADTLIHHPYPEQDWPKPFPLKAEYRTIDMPLWDGGGIPPDIENQICALSPECPNPADEDTLDYFKDIHHDDEHSYSHKLGGYPSYAQSGIGLEFQPGYEFVLQITSDEKADFNIIDSGSLMFARNAESGNWLLYYDFY